MSILKGFKKKKNIPSDSVVPEVIHRAEKVLSAPGGVILLRTATELKVTEVPMSTSGIGGGLFAFLCQKEGTESVQDKQPGTRGRVLREKKQFGGKMLVPLREGVDMWGNTVWHIAVPNQLVVGHPQSCHGDKDRPH